jgi:hypothetical protein
METYTCDTFKNDLFTAMKSNKFIYSGRPLGNTENIKLWTNDKIKSFYNGIITSHKVFFRNEFSLKDFSRLIICESMQESTGNFNLGVRKVRFDDHTSMGIIQVTPGSVLKDYSMFGLCMIDVNGKMINPNYTTDIDLSDPGLCIQIWSWYNKNCVLMKMSMNEWIHRIEWNSNPSNVKPLYKNVLYNWLAGPHNDVDLKPGPFEDYYLRVLDYFVVSGFGNKDYFDKLMNTTISNNIKGIHNGKNNKINNRDNCIGIKELFTK